MIQEVLPLSQEEIRKLKYRYGSSAINVRTPFRGMLDVLIEDVNTKEKMAFVIHKRYGHGIFNILLRERDVKKRFDERFSCLAKACPFHKTPRCKVYGQTPQHGLICAKNKRTNVNWWVRGCVKIFPSQHFNDTLNDLEDFEFVWVTNLNGYARDRMKKYAWFSHANVMTQQEAMRRDIQNLKKYDDADDY